MRRGLGTLFLTTLAVTLFVNPITVPQSASSSVSVPQSLGNATARPKDLTPVPEGKSSPKPSPSPSSCALTSKSPCRDCSQFCPAKGLLDTIAAFFGPKAGQEQKIAAPCESTQSKKLSSKTATFSRDPICRGTPTSTLKTLIFAYASRRTITATFATHTPD